MSTILPGRAPRRQRQRRIGRLVICHRGGRRRPHPDVRGSPAAPAREIATRPGLRRPRDRRLGCVVRIAHRAARIPSRTTTKAPSPVWVSHAARSPAALPSRSRTDRKPRRRQMLKQCFERRGVQAEAGGLLRAASPAPRAAREKVDGAGRAIIRRAQECRSCAAPPERIAGRQPRHPSAAAGEHRDPPKTGTGQRRPRASTRQAEVARPADTISLSRSASRLIDKPKAILAITDDREPGIGCERTGESDMSASFPGRHEGTSQIGRELAAAGMPEVYSYAGRTATPVCATLPTRVAVWRRRPAREYIKQERMTHGSDATHPFAADQRQCRGSLRQDCHAADRLSREPLGAVAR